VTISPGALLLTYAGREPDVASDAWVAPGATLVGAVTLATGVSVWFGAVMRADGDSIAIGRNSNAQDGCVIHADPGVPVTVGQGVSIGHRAIVHGCLIDDDVLVGMGAVVLNHAHIGSGSLVAAGAVVLEGAMVPPGSLVAGVPARVRRELTPAEHEAVRSTATHYVDLVSRYTGDSRR
jgi:carbonic anhydrase/acetyltransferase-like protein (isoleucine patch superfamily)